MPTNQPTQAHHILRLLLSRTSRQLLWIVTVGCVGLGYSMLWHPAGFVFDLPTVARNVYVGISLVIAGGLLGLMLFVSRP